MPPLNNGATRDLARSLKKTPLSFLPRTLNPWQGNLHLMGPNLFSLFCTFEIIFACLAIGILFQVLPLLRMQISDTDYRYMACFMGLIIIHAAALIYSGLRGNFQTYYAYPSLLIAYASYISWPIATSGDSGVLPWSWLLGVYGMLSPLCLASKREIITHIAGLSVALFLSELSVKLIYHLDTPLLRICSHVIFFICLVTLITGFTSLALTTASRADSIYARVISAQLNFNRSRDYAREQQEFDKLVHDNVMAALLDASRVEGPIAERTRALAQRALHVLDEETNKAMPHRPVSFQELAEQVALGVEPWNSRLRFTSVDEEKHEPADPDSTLPQEAAQAFTHAVTEAVSNSARHSDSRITNISIHTEFRRPLKGGRNSPEKPFIICTISDRGKGFNIKALDLRRMGVRVSMLHSMEQVGGQVNIKSVPQRGTNVTIQWPNEETDAGSIL